MRGPRTQAGRRALRKFLLIGVAAGAVLGAEPAGAASWNFETLDGAGGSNGRVSGDVGYSSSTLIYGGQPHTWYYDASGGDLRHAWWTGSAWNFETLDGAGGTSGRVSGDVGYSSSTLLYGGLPHVWYHDASNGELRHAWWTGSGWTFESLDGAGGTNGRIVANVGADSSTLLYAGQPHVWYRDDSGADLRHAWWTGSAWSFETLDGAGGANGRIVANLGQHASTLLYGGQPHAWYWNATSGDLRHAWWTGAAWAFETLDGAGGANGRVSADVGFNSSTLLYGGQPHTWYYDSSFGDLRHAWWTGAAWAFETLDGAGGVNGRIAADVGYDSSTLLYGGQPHVWYWDSSTGDLRHGWWTGAAWAFETLDGAGGGSGRLSTDLGSDTSALLYGGLPHALYFDTSNGNLRHAWYG